MNLGGHPVGSFLFTNQTIAASAGGTAAATVLGTINASYARSWNVTNLTLRNLEFVLGAEAGTSAIGIFIPGNVTASGAAAGGATRSPIALQQGIILRARTTENVPLTISSTLALAITLWA